MKNETKRTLEKLLIEGRQEAVKKITSPKNEDKSFWRRRLKALREAEDDLKNQNHTTP